MVRDGAGLGRGGTPPPGGGGLTNTHPQGGWLVSCTLGWLVGFFHFGISSRGLLARAMGIVVLTRAMGLVVLTRAVGLLGWSQSSCSPGANRRGLFHTTRA